MQLPEKGRKALLLGKFNGGEARKEIDYVSTGA